MYACHRHDNLFQQAVFELESEGRRRVGGTEEGEMKKKKITVEKRSVDSQKAIGDKIRRSVALIIAGLGWSGGITSKLA